MKKSEAAQGLVEYALILVLVAIVVIAILLVLGPMVGDTLCDPPTPLSDVDPEDPSMLCINPVDDHVYTPPDTARIINVANNDSSYGAWILDPTSTVLVGESPGNGRVVKNEDGTFTYEPDSGFIGIDTFSYRIYARLDTLAYWDRAIVKIGIGVLVDAVDDCAEGELISANSPFHIAQFNVNSNDFILNGVNDHPPDPSEVPFSIVYTDPDHGRLDYYEGTGLFSYFADPGYSGQDEFEYEICNINGTCDQAQVTLYIDTADGCPNGTAIAASSSEILASASVELTSLLELQRGPLLTQEDTADDLDPENLLNLYEEATNQDAAFTLASYPIKEIVHEFIDVLLASEDLSEETKEALPDIEQDFNSGDVERITSAMEELIFIVEETPAIEFNQVIAATRYHWLAACVALDGAEVSSYEAALETLYLMEEMDPGRTGNAIPEMEEIGGYVEFRNGVVAFSAEMCALILEALLDFDDLYQAIADGAIDEEGVRQSFHDQASEAEDAFYDENLKESGNTLCALLNHLEAQDGKHVDPASAEEIRNTVTAVAAQLGIPLPCNQ